MATRKKTAHMTFSIPIETKKRAQAMRDVNWSAVVTRTIEERLKILDFMDKALAKSKLTQRDVDEIAKSINQNIARSHGLIK